MIIALTGNIGSGKSTAAALFEDAGYHIINADHIGHDLYKREDIKQKVIDRFGRKILTDDEIDRKKLKKIVFYDPDELKVLNQIMHPEIIKEIHSRIKSLRHDKILIEAALILEFGFKDYDRLIVMTIDQDRQIERLLKKGKYNKDEINNILKSQLSQEKKIESADYIIDNSGTLEELKKNINKVIIRLKSQI